jgi:molybdopterin converting factor small subunit
LRRIATDLDGAATADVVPAEAPEEVAAALRRELDLYEPMQLVIGAEWAKDHRAKPLAVEVTAQQGRRATGIWARPDIVSVEVRTFAHMPSKYIEVITFEVKPSDGISVQAVYEALAHRRAATRSDVLLHVPAERRDELETAVADISEVARAHGIGVVTAEDPGDYENLGGA